MSIDSEGNGTRCLHTIRQGSEVLGFIAIDSMVSGRARGGLRLLPDVGAEELRAAARAMTLKYGFLGLPQGGAKAGIRGEGEVGVEAKRLRLHEFALAAEPLLRDRRYVPDADMGTSAGDIRWMVRSIGLPVSRHDWRHDRSGHYTAVSCMAAAATALRHRGASLAGRRVAIEGFGRVGSALAHLLDRVGATVVAISTSRGALYRPGGLDVKRLLAVAAEAGSAVVERYTDADHLDREALLELPVDLLCPCARHNSIHAGNARRIAAPVVCAGANDSVDPEAERILWSRGVTCPPDFVANCGGVLGGTLEFAGVGGDRIAALIEQHITRSVGGLLETARRQEVPPRAVAEPLALAEHERVRSAADRPRARDRVVGFGLGLYRRGWLPKRMVAAIAPTYIEGSLRRGVSFPVDA